MARKLLTGADLSGQRIQNLADGTGPADAVTKAQLDAIARGVAYKAPVRVATTANITLTGAQTVNGVAVVAGDRVLVKDQSTASQNGLYVVASGAWARADDLAAGAIVQGGIAVSTQGGTVDGDKVFLLTSDGAITVGTTAQAWAAMGGGTSYTAGDGLDLTGSSFSVDLKAGGGLVIDTTELAVDITALRTLGLVAKFAQDVPTSGTTVTITHSLNTTDVQVTVMLKATGEVVECDVLATGVNTVSLTFAVTPTAAQYRVVVMG